jgi:aspartyl-tRNA(Asn)/glutamyl-tRNA(Gln) amidotransferase subunit B
VANREAVAMAVKAGLALGCSINQNSLFARKNYFYPDLPKGYQISQFDRPIAEAGRVELPVALGDPAGDTLVYEKRSFGITRLHLEDDAGKSIHTAVVGTQVNLNRTGTPLIEIVTEADFRSSQEAYAFLNYLKSVLLYLEVCDGNMEEGSLRCDANVSIRPVGSSTFGTKTEIKNLNSFRFLRKALDYEIQRQIRVIQGGGTISQETRLWDEESQQTFPMRSKEEAHDYRYFPEPDLLPLVVSDDWLDQLSRELPELPEARRVRFVEEYGLEAEPAMHLTQSRAFADYFETAIKHNRQPVGIYNWMIGDLTRELKRDGREIGASPVTPQNLATLVRLIDKGAISGKIAKDVFSKMYGSGRDPEAIIADEGLKQISDVGELEKIIDKVIQSHPNEVETYRSGKTGLIGFFVGQVMRETRGQANPRIVNEVLRKKLGAT